VTKKAPIAGAPSLARVAPGPDARLRHVAALYAKGKSGDDIADELGCSRSLVYGDLRELDLLLYSRTDLLSIPKASALHGLHHETLREAAKEGRVPGAVQLRRGSRTYIYIDEQLFAPFVQALPRCHFAGCATRVLGRSGYCRTHAGASPRERRRPRVHPRPAPRRCGYRGCAEDFEPSAYADAHGDGDYCSREHAALEREARRRDAVAEYAGEHGLWTAAKTAEELGVHPTLLSGYVARDLLACTRFDPGSRRPILLFEPRDVGRFARRLRNASRRREFGSDLRRHLSGAPRKDAVRRVLLEAAEDLLDDDPDLTLTQLAGILAAGVAWQECPGWLPRGWASAADPRELSRTFRTPAIDRVRKLLGSELKDLQIARKKSAAA
jgi:hypothetical protein